MDAAGINQTEPVLDTRAAIWNFGKVVLAQFLLFFEAEGTMIGRDHLQCVAGEALP